MFVLTFRSLLQYLPKLALSIMILFAVAKLIDVPTIIRYYKVSPWDCATMLVTLCMKTRRLGTPRHAVRTYIWARSDAGERSTSRW